MGRFPFSSYNIIQEDKVMDSPHQYTLEFLVVNFVSGLFGSFTHTSEFRSISNVPKMFKISAGVNEIHTILYQK